jgi:hypothetical protein
MALAFEDLPFFASSFWGEIDEMVGWEMYSDLGLFDSWKLDMYIVFLYSEKGWNGDGIPAEETIEKRVYGPLCSNTTPQHNIHTNIREYMISRHAPAPFFVHIHMHIYMNLTRTRK